VKRGEDSDRRPWFRRGPLLNRGVLGAVPCTGPEIHVGGQNLHRVTRPPGALRRPPSLWKPRGPRAAVSPEVKAKLLFPVRGIQRSPPCPPPTPRGSRRWSRGLWARDTDSIVRSMPARRSFSADRFDLIPLPAVLTRMFRSEGRWPCSRREPTGTNRGVSTGQPNEAWCPRMGPLPISSSSRETGQTVSADDFLELLG